MSLDTNVEVVHKAPLSGLHGSGWEGRLRRHS